MKHIESIQPEYAAEELERIVREEGDATASAALSRLLHDWTGCAIPQTDTTPQSDVDELVPLAVSILRRHWQTPLTALGDGTTPMSLADLFRQLIGDRVQGNEALGIPSANESIPHAVSALRERKIGGVPDAPDGVSLPRLLCDSTIADTITELIDDNIGWVMDKTPTLPSTLTKLVLNCKEMNNVMLRADSVAELELPYLEEFKSNVYNGENRIIFNGETLYLPKLRYYEGYYNTIAPYVGIVACGAFKNFIAPNLEGINDQSGWHDCFLAGLNNETPYDRLEKVVLGKLKVFNWGFGGNYYTNNVSKQTNLIHFEIGEGTNISLNCSKWNPTTALAERLDEFLSNFRLYIADRLSDNGSGKTLTLSQEVRDAIHSAGIDTIITNKGWTISPVPTQQ